MTAPALPRPVGPPRSTVGLAEVLELFRRDQAELTRADVIGLTGLSRSTVNLRLEALLGAGLLVPVAEEARTRGRPAGQFAFNRDRGVLLVADVGATGARLALCDLKGAVQAERTVACSVTDGPEPVLGVVRSVFADLLADAGRPATDVLGVGIDVPGPVDAAAGLVVSPPIMTGWDRYDIPGWFGQHYDCPVVVEKDANAMALGEQRAHHPEAQHLLFVKAGTGIGTGIIAGGQLHHGADGAAGDLGHVHITVLDVEQEPDCRCGNSGCVEAYAGGWALVRDLRAAGHDVHDVDSAVALVRTGDDTAVRVARRAARILGEAIADAVNLLNPRAVVVGGQLATTDQILFAGIREMVYRRSLPLATRNLQIVRSELGPHAGVAGMALLVADRIFCAERVDTLVASALAD
ncbi:ROK family protein [Motilibacter aurantiacus]|uniref:ROK family protein n=1 Tax=Motilibacter aurantiacus TaxID=2714955 RepID=UPI002F2B87F6